MRWYSLVGLVDVLDGQDGQVAVIPEVTQCDLLAGRKTQLIDLRLRYVQSDGHGKENAIGETVVLDDSVARIWLEPRLISNLQLNL